MDDVKHALPDRPVKLLDQIRHRIRAEGKSYATEKTYIYWIRHFIAFHNKAHPVAVGPAGVAAFLEHLAVRADVASNTQKTALNALNYLFTHHLGIPLEQLGFRYAAPSKRIPTVFTHEEAMAIINVLEPPYDLMAKLMYGSGLRISEMVNLRVKDIDFGMGYVIVRSGKGNKDRTTLLPKSLIPCLEQQILSVERLLARDTEDGVGPVYLPNQLEKKYPYFGRSLSWQFLFPSVNTSLDPRSNVARRHHVYRGTVQNKVKHAIRQSGIHKQASCHTFRHSFATRLLQDKYDLKQIQLLMGHEDITTTEIYLHVLDELGEKVKSPID